MLLRQVICLVVLLSSPGLIRAQEGPRLLGNLPEIVSETSGLLVIGPQLLTHNDSGNEPLLYYLDTVNLEIQREVRVEGVSNTDWEDLAEDADYVYIGDFGNTRGTRTDLAIYRVAKSDLASGNTSVSADRIGYAYEDQEDFSGTSNSDWDAEALVVRGDSLIVFTKQWQGNATVAYRIPKSPGDHLAVRSGTYDAGGLITGATPRPGGGFALLGYTSVLQPFLIDVPQTIGPFGFPPETSRQLLDIGFGQAEGITADASGRYFVSTESFSNSLATLPASVYTFTRDSEGEPPGGDPEEPGEPTDPGDGGGGPEPGSPNQPGGLVIYRPAGSDELRYELDRPAPILARAVFDTAGRMVLFENAPEIDAGRLDIATLNTSVYYLTLYFRGAILSEPFLRY